MQQAFLGWTKLQLVVVALILCWLLSHFPFLFADASANLSGSRGPFTDEGLYTSTLRNYINYGYLNLYGSDGFVKSPGFNFLLFFPFKIVGISQEIGRGVILTTSLLLILLLSSSAYFRKMLIILIPVGLMKFQIHQFNHLCLAEILVSYAGLAGMFYFHRYRMREEYRYWSLITATGIFFIAFLLKIQYVYLLLLIPLMLVLEWLRQPGHINLLKPLSISGFTIIILAGLFAAGWYFPLRAGFDFMLEEQSGGVRLSEKTWDTVKYIVEHIFFARKNRLFTIVFLLSLVTGGYLVFKKSSRNFLIAYQFIGCWILLETHKLVMNYLPTRYLTSTYMAMAVMIAIVFAELLFNQDILRGRVRRWLVALVAGVLLILVVDNGVTYMKEYRARSFGIYQTRVYLSKFDLEGKAILGNWAPSLYWSADAQVVPVTLKNWHRIKPLENYQPVLIIEEPDEGGSNQAYRSNGVDLSAISDSVRQVTVGKWTLNLYWQKE